MHREGYWQAAAIQAVVVTWGHRKRNILTQGKKTGVVVGLRPDERTQVTIPPLQRATMPPLQRPPKAYGVRK